MSSYLDYNLLYLNFSNILNLRKSSRVIQNTKLIIDLTKFTFKLFQNLYTKIVNNRVLQIRIGYTYIKVLKVSKKVLYILYSLYILYIYSFNKLFIDILKVF